MSVTHPSTQHRRRDALPRAVVATTALLGLLIVLPWLIWSWRHNPLPQQFHPLRWAQLAADGYVGPDVIPDLLAIAIWLVWAQFVVAVGLELIARVSRGAAAPRSIVVIVPVQRLVTQLVAAITIVLSAHPAGAAVPSLHNPTASTAMTDPGDPEIDNAGSVAGSRADATGATRYVCGPYDTLRSIAGIAYGNPDAWTRIRDASVGQAQDDGTRLRAGFIAVAEGVRLVVPAAPVQHVQIMANHPAGTTTAEGKRVSRPAELGPDVDHHTVRRGETLWGIAEARYVRADPTDLPTIVDAIAATNEGVSDGHGHRLHDEDQINPGMNLELPTLDRAAQTTAPNRNHPRDTDERIPVLPAPPTRSNPASPPPTSPPSSPEARSTPDGTAQDTPDPWALLSAPLRATPSGAGLHSAPAASATHSPSPQTSPIDTGQNISWLAGGAGGLLATGFLGVWSYRRRRRDAKVRPGQQLPVSTPALTSLHTGIRVAADPTTTARIDGALRSLARLHATDTSTSAPITQVLFRQRSGDIDVLLRDDIATIPPPWLPTSDPRIWRLPAAADLTLEPSDLERPHPNPTLVQLGVTTDDDAELYLDLENIGRLGIDDTGADPDALRALARAFTATLTTSPLADIPRIRTTGFDPYGLAVEERLHDHAGVTDLIDQTEKDAREVQRQLRTHEAGTTLALRVRHPEETADPTVAIIADHTLTSQDAEQLTNLTGEGSLGIAAVIPLTAAPRTRWRLVHQPEPTGAWITPRLVDHNHPVPITTASPRPRWRLDPLGITLHPVTLAAAELAALAELLEEAETPATDTEPAPLSLRVVSEPAAEKSLSFDGHQSTTDRLILGHPDQAEQVNPARNSRSAVPKQGSGDRSSDPVFSGPDWQVMVRLFGPVDVVDRDGNTPERMRDRTVELLAWLVLHRHGTRAQLEAALWPTGARSGTVSNTLSRARTALEELAGPQAHEWIPGYQTELRIDPAVTTDLAVLEAHVDWADQQATHPKAAIAALRDGLGLVRGVPEGYPWLDAELGSTLTITVTTTAIRLAQLCLDEGDIEGALRATTSGLAILPAHPELFALRMRARAATGDRTGVRAEYEAYLRAENADPLADGETDRDLEHLFLQLKK